MWPKDPEFILQDGRRIRLIKMFRENVYHSLLEGSPFRRHNYDIIMRLLYWERTLMRWATDGREPALLPTGLVNRKTKQLEPSEWYAFKGIPLPPPERARPIFDEWMPGIGTVALFVSDAIRNDPSHGDTSYLSIIWFQKSAEALIEEEPREELFKVNWDGLARSWSF